MIDKILKILQVIAEILPFISKLSDRIKPLEKEKSWRDKL
jgi:hypothetical protein